jgi:hypothetical protein
MGYKISDLPPELRSDFDLNANKKGGNETNFYEYNTKHKGECPK